MEAKHNSREIIKKILYFLKVRNERVHILETLNIRINFEEDNIPIDLISDIIGFPQDNTLEFDYDFLNGQREIPQKGLRIDFDNAFCRDWLNEKILDFIDGNSDFKNDDELINWLYTEYVNMEI